MRNAGMLVLVFLLSCQEDFDHQINPIPEPEAEKSFSALIPDQYIVVFDTEKTGEASARYADPTQARQFVMEQTLRIVRTVEPAFSEKRLSGIFSATINGAVLQLPSHKIAALRQDERVAYIEQDRTITLAPSNRKEGGASATQETPYGIVRVNGGVSYSGSSVAWVIDTGIDLDHPDLKVDAKRGFNAFKSGRDAKTLDDGNGHGTHVAGTIAAVNNNTGVIGVAAGATVVPVKVLDTRGSGSYSGVIAGVDYVANNGKAGDVANMSLGGPVSRALDDAVIAAASKGIKFTLAAGNDGEDANNHSPARANGINIYTISAMDANDTWANFSNFGNPPVDYCAPGVSIKSTYKNGGYAILSGTSMAAPHAAGVLLLGSPNTDGQVAGDTDGNPDVIIVH